MYIWGLLGDHGGEIGQKCAQDHVSDCLTSGLNPKIISFKKTGIIPVMHVKKTLA